MAPQLAWLGLGNMGRVSSLSDNRTKEPQVLISCTGYVQKFGGEGEA